MEMEMANLNPMKSNISSDPDVRPYQLMAFAVIEQALRDAVGSDRVERISAKLFFRSRDFDFWIDVCGADRDVIRRGIDLFLKKHSVPLSDVDDIDDAPDASEPMEEDHDSDASLSHQSALRQHVAPVVG